MTHEEAFYARVLDLQPGETMTCYNWQGAEVRIYMADSPALLDRYRECEGRIEQLFSFDPCPDKMTPIERLEAFLDAELLMIRAASPPIPENPSQVPASNIDHDTWPPLKPRERWVCGGCGRDLPASWVCDCGEFKAVRKGI